MRNHDKFIEMPLVEKWITQGKIWHAYATNRTIFDEINKLVKVAEDAGVFQDVQIFAPDNKPENDLPNDH